MTDAIFLLRVVTWVAIVANWAVLLRLARQLKRANRDFWKMNVDANHWSIVAVFTMMKLQEVAPGTPVPLPPETQAWMEGRALENMVYGDEVPPSE